MNLKYLFNILCCCLATICDAQINYTDLPQIMPQTPEATQLIRSILYPVDYSTGLPQIEIPLYEIKLKDGTVLPIKLVYHASGFKPGEAKQRVGVGWSLQAEPQISRSVNGNPDEWYYFKEPRLDYYNKLNLTSACYGGEADFCPDRFFISY